MIKLNHYIVSSFHSKLTQIDCNWTEKDKGQLGNQLKKKKLGNKPEYYVLNRYNYHGIPLSH